MKVASFLLICLAAFLLVMASLGLPAVGDPGSAPATHVSPRYIQGSYEETGTENMVTGIIADYRGYDTLGETVVIFTAGIACLLLLRSRDDEEGGKAS